MKTLLLLLLSTSCYAACVGPYCYDDTGAHISGLTIGTLLFSDGSSQTTAASGGGSITASTITYISVSSTTHALNFVPTGLKNNFTLSNAAHKVKISVFGDVNIAPTAGTCYVTIAKDGTPLDTTTNGFMQGFGDQTDPDWFFSFSILATANTSAHSYEVYFKNDNQSNPTCILCNNSSQCGILLEEVQ